MLGANEDLSVKLGDAFISRYIRIVDSDKSFQDLLWFSLCLNLLVHFVEASE